jgi:hypothetical protein
MNKIVTIIIDQNDGVINTSINGLTPIELIGISEHLKELGKSAMKHKSRIMQDNKQLDKEMD